MNVAVRKVCRYLSGIARSDSPMLHPRSMAGLHASYVVVADDELRKQCGSPALLSGHGNPYPQRTHILRLWGPKILLYEAFG